MKNGSEDGLWLCADNEDHLGSALELGAVYAAHVSGAYRYGPELGGGWSISRFLNYDELYDEASAENAAFDLAKAKKFFTGDNVVWNGRGDTLNLSDPLVGGALLEAGTVYTVVGYPPEVTIYGPGKAVSISPGRGHQNCWHVSEGALELYDHGAEQVLPDRASKAPCSMSWETPQGAEPWVSDIGQPEGGVPKGSVHWGFCGELAEAPPDVVYQPHHYARFAIEPVTFINANVLPYNIGNVIKYVCRYDAKNGIEDLEKAKRYIDMQIETIRRHQRIATGEDRADVWKVAL